MKNTFSVITIIITSLILTACPHFDMEGEGGAEFDTTLYSVRELDGSHDGYVGYSTGDITLEQTPWGDTRGYLSFDLRQLREKAEKNTGIKIHSCKLWLSSNGYTYGQSFYSFAVSHVTFDDLDAWDTNIHRLNNPNSPDIDQWDKTFSYGANSLESGRWITVDVKNWCQGDVSKGRTYTQFEIRLDNETVEDSMSVRFQEGISEGNPKLDTYRAPYLDISYE